MEQRGAGLPSACTVAQKRVLNWPRAPRTGGEKFGMASGVVSEASRAGRGICQPRQNQPPCPTSRCCWGHAHLGGIQGILGDVVLHGSTIAVASHPESQAPGWAHGAVLLNIIVALQDLHGSQTHGQAQSPVSDTVGHPSLTSCTAEILHGMEKGGAPWEERAESGENGLPLRAGPALSVQQTCSLILTAAPAQAWAGM